MPYCLLSMSSDLSNNQMKDLSIKIQEVFIEIAKKSPESIMINIVPNCNLSLGGKNDAAFFHINTVNINDTLKEELGSRFLDIISSIANISYDRIFIYFNISDPVNWFLRGHTLKYWKEKNHDSTSASPLG